MNWEDFWEYADERRRYHTTVVWMNSFGLPFGIIATIRTNNRLKDSPVKTANTEGLQQDITKLMVFVGIIMLALSSVWPMSDSLLTIAGILIYWGMWGMVEPTILRVNLLIWQNSLGLLVQIVKRIIADKKDNDYFTAQSNTNELGKDIERLSLIMGSVLLGISIGITQSNIMMIIALCLLGIWGLQIIIRKICEEMSSW